MKNNAKKNKVFLIFSKILQISLYQCFKKIKPLINNYFITFSFLIHSVMKLTF
jgi:hypothetical protein